MLIQDDEEMQQITNSCADEQSIRLTPLNFAKDVLQTKAAMRWETHKQLEDISIDDIIAETRKLYSYVNEGNNS